MFSRPAQHPLDRDLRRLRKVLAGMLIFLLLPWLFVQSNISCNQYSPTRSCRTNQEEEQLLPEPATVAEPVPSTYPAFVTYQAVSSALVQGWLNQHYPDSLINTPADLGQIALAAKHYNVNEFLLLGILGAEQGFLSPSAVGAYRAILFSQNPFDYGVYPGSPYAFNIGVYQSALGAASIVARVVEGFPPDGAKWTASTLDSFYLALSGFYVNGNANSVDISWVHNVTAFSASMWAYTSSHWTSELAYLLSLMSPAQLAVMAVHLGQSVAGIVKHIDAATVHTVTGWLLAIGVSAAVAAIIAEVVGVIVAGASAVGAVAAAA